MALSRRGGVVGELRESDEGLLEWRRLALVVRVWLWISVMRSPLAVGRKGSGAGGG